MMSPINLEIKDTKKFNELEIGDYFIFIEKNVKVSCLNQKLTKDTFDDSQNKLKLIGNDIYLPVIKVNLNNYIFADDSLLENKTTVTPAENEVKESCNNLHSIFTFISEGLVCSKCHTLLATKIKSELYWNIFDPKARELIKENVSLANLFKEWSSFKKSSSIDQTSLINNQIQKIAEQEAEIKRLEKIIINQAEIIGNKSNG